MVAEDVSLRRRVLKEVYSREGRNKETKTQLNLRIVGRPDLIRPGHLFRLAISNPESCHQHAKRSLQIRFREAGTLSGLGRDGRSVPCENLFKHVSRRQSRARQPALFLRDSSRTSTAQKQHWFLPPWSISRHHVVEQSHQTSHCRL